MTQEQKNEKIAAICGYKIGYRDPEAWHPLPNYFEDLNAMHEAEKTLEGGKAWNRYTDELGKLCHYKPNIHDVRSFVNIIVSATATQRAEAFGKTLNLW